MAARPAAAKEDAKMTSDLASLCILPEDSLREAISRINRNEKGIVLVCDGEGHLLGTVTDGDVRRALLAGQDLDSPAGELLGRKADSPYSRPVTAPIGTAPGALLQTLQEREVHQLPLLDEEGRVAGLVTLDDLLPDRVLPLQAVIMAGGFGTRLRPLTEDLPKPMLPLGDRPLMELIVRQLGDTGIRRVNVTTHFMPEKIKEHFGDGRRFGVELNYVTEDRPLGTAGALGLMSEPEEPLLVINGDILTRVNFRSMHLFHREHGAALTVAVRKYDMNVPYGVVESDGAFVRGLVEKPLLSFYVNAGIYLLEPRVRRYISDGERLNMTDLIQRLLDDNQPVVSFPVLEYWLDIGSSVDYERAQEDVRNGRYAS